MEISKKWQKWILISAPILLGVYLIYKQLNPSKATVYNKPTPKPTLAKPSTDAEAKNFPLKVGSHNDYVKMLQDALGVAIDGIFGSKQTLPALQEQANKSQIADYNDLISTIQAIEANDAANAQQKANDAKLFIDIYKNTPVGFTIIPSQDIRINQLSGVGNQYNYLDTYMNLQEGYSYLGYIPLDITSRGDLVVRYTDNTGNQSTWAIDSTLLNR